MTKKNEKSFTLIELLLGFTIFALTALTFYSVFSNGVRINSKADQSEQLYRELRWSLDVLTLDLENMVNYEGYSKDLGPFQGEQESLSLALPTDSGLKIIRYSLKSPEETKIFTTKIGEHSSKNKPIIVNYSEEQKIEFLIREESPFFVSGKADSQAQGEPEILSTHVQPGSLRFSYGYQEKKEGQPGDLTWKDEWSDIHLPAVVRVELSFVDSDESNEPLAVHKDIFVPVGSWGPAPPQSQVQ